MSTLLPVAVGVPVGLGALYGASLIAARIHPHLPQRPVKPAAEPERSRPAAQPRVTEPYEAGGMTVGAAEGDRYEAVQR